MKAELKPEHQWLEQFLGDWTIKGGNPDPNGEPFTGEESFRSMGGAWVIGEANTPTGTDQPFQNVLTLGYDTDRKQFVGTFIASAMTHLWIYTGSLSEDGKTLTLETEGPNFVTPGGRSNYRDVITFDDANHRRMTSFMQDAEGNWNQVMEMKYERK